MANRITKVALAALTQRPKLPAARAAGGEVAERPYYPGLLPQKFAGGGTPKTPRDLSAIGLYSHGAEAAAALPQAKGSPQQFKAMLKKAGVKDAELENSGFDSVFADRPSVTRDEIAQHFKQSMPQVEERVLGSNQNSIARSEWIEKQAARNAEHVGDINHVRDWDEAPEHVRQWHADEAARHFDEMFHTDPDFKEKFSDPDSTKFSKYTLPGGENYREVLLKAPETVGVPEQTLSDLAAARERSQSASKAYNDVLAAELEGTSSIPAEQVEALRKEDDIARARLKNFEQIAKQSGFKSGHWDDPNVLVHLRMSDRTGPNGEKILHVEEIQSDWGQEGRKSGFKDTSQDWNKKYNTFKDEIVNKWVEEKSQQVIAEHPGLYNDIDEARETARKVAKVRGVSEIANDLGLAEQHQNLYDKMDSFRNNIPSAPYVTSTQGWTDLALKRILKEAAEGGYDKIIWTPGEEQAKRYDLSRQVDSVHYNPEDKRLVGYKNGKPVFGQSGIDADQLPSFVGKEVASKLLQTEKQPHPIFDKNENFFEQSTPVHSIEGSDLAVGGAGMKAYYDKIVPTRLQELIKRHDPTAKVGMTNIMLPPSSNRSSNDPPIQAPGIDITPPMRDSIMQGQHSFARGGMPESPPSPPQTQQTPPTTPTRTRPAFAIPPAQDIASDTPTDMPKSDTSNPTTMSLATAFDNAIAHHLSLSRGDRIANSKEAIKRLAPHVGMRKDKTLVPLLGKNEKLLKTETGYKGEDPVKLEDGRGIEAAGLALSPSFQMQGFNTCPNSASCKDECLGKTSGNYFKVGGGKDLNAFEGPRLNSLNKTLAMINEPEAFAVRLHDEIAAKRQEAANNGNLLGVRLNTLSDINPRVHQAIIKAFPDVVFYDYTKMAHKPVASNHHYTYSSTGVSQDDVDNPNSNWPRMRRMLEGGENVAMAFSDKEHLPETVHDQETNKVYRVVNGDMHDFRPMDRVPDGEAGVIIGLKNKKGFGTINNAHKESKGFFVKYDPGRQLTKKGTYERHPSQEIGPSGKPKLGPTKVTNTQVSIKPQMTIKEKGQGYE